MTDEVGPMFLDKQPVMAPLIFNDARDIKEVFWTNYIPQYMPDYDAAPENKGKKKGKGIPVGSINIPRTGVRT